MRVYNVVFQLSTDQMLKVFSFSIKEQYYEVQISSGINFTNALEILKWDARGGSDDIRSSTICTSCVTRHAVFSPYWGDEKDDPIIQLLCSLNVILVSTTEALHQTVCSDSSGDWDDDLELQLNWGMALIFDIYANHHNLCK